MRLNLSAFAISFALILLQILVSDSQTRLSHDLYLLCLIEGFANEYREMVFDRGYTVSRHQGFKRDSSILIHKRLNGTRRCLRRNGHVEIS